MKDVIVRKINRDLKKKPLYKLARAIGIPYATFHRIVHGNGNMTLKTWDKITSYYKDN